MFNQKIYHGTSSLLIGYYGGKTVFFNYFGERKYKIVLSLKKENFNKLQLFGVSEQLRRYLCYCRGFIPMLKIVLKR